MKIKKELLDRLKSQGNNIFIKSEKKVIRYDEFLDLVSKSITFIQENFPKKKLIFINKSTEEFFIFFIACLFSDHQIFVIDPYTKPKKIEEIKKKLKFDYIVKNFNLKKIKLKKYGKFSCKDNDFLLIPSSGTSTGEPKAILHTSKSLLNSAKSFAELVEYNDKTIVYHCMPTFYMGGIVNTFLSCIFSNSQIGIGPTANLTNLDKFWDSTKKLGINSFHLTPSILLAMCIMHKPNRALTDHLAEYQSLISTGSYLYPEIRDKFFKIFKRRIQTCWGVTELGGPLTCEKIEDILFEDDNKNSVGKVSSKIKIKIQKNKNISINSPFIMKGYVKKNGIIEKPKLNKGYYNTGDLGSYKNKILSYFGRNKEIIKVGGELVSLTDVENTVLKSKMVKECASVGVSNLYSGEDLILFVVLRKNKINSQIEKIKKFLIKELKNIELPKKIIPIVEMPKTKNGKIIKTKLKDLYIQ